MNRLRKFVVIIHKMEFYSAIKKNEIMPFGGKWMALENINAKLSEPGLKSQRSYVFPHMWKLHL
jgi:hypothetical protein